MNLIVNDDVMFRRRHLKGFTNQPDSIATGLGAAGFEKADMALRHTSIHRQIKLAHVPSVPPGFEQRSKGVLWSVHQICHASF